MVWWEHYLEQLHERENASREQWWTPPPLMSVTVWTRAQGKLAVRLIIAFLEWCSFMSFMFWMQVSASDLLPARSMDIEVLTRAYYHSSITKITSA